MVRGGYPDLEFGCTGRRRNARGPTPGSWPRTGPFADGFEEYTVDGGQFSISTGDGPAPIARTVGLHLCVFDHRRLPLCQAD